MRIKHSVTLTGEGWTYVVTVCICCKKNYHQRVRDPDGELGPGRTITAVCPASGGMQPQNITEMVGGAEDVREQYGLADDTYTVRGVVRDHGA